MQAVPDDSGSVWPIQAMFVAWQRACRLTSGTRGIPDPVTSAVPVRPPVAPQPLRCCCHDASETRERACTDFATLNAQDRHKRLWALC
jgi:hypothetical protein